VLLTTVEPVFGGGGDCIGVGTTAVPEPPPQPPQPLTSRVRRASQNDEVFRNTKQTLFNTKLKDKALINFKDTPARLRRSVRSIGRIIERMFARSWVVRSQLSQDPVRRRSLLQFLICFCDEAANIHLQCFQARKRPVLVWFGLINYYD